MAFETGTATDYRDLLQKLKLFLTGTGSPSSGLNWTVMEERSQYTSPLSDIPAGDVDALEKDSANHNQSHDQIIFKGTGGVSPENPVYFGIQTYGLSTLGFFNWQIRGLTGYSSNSPQTRLQDQPGRSPPTYLPLQNSSMTYWFAGNDRHVKGVIKTGTSYQPFYIGFLNVYGTQAQYPYPLYIGASSSEEDRVFSNNDTRFSGYMHPGSESSDVQTPNNLDVFPSNSATAYLRLNDGTWVVQKHFFSSPTETRLQGTSGTSIFAHPCAQWNDAALSAGSALGDDTVFGTDFSNQNPGGNPNSAIIPGLGSPQFVQMWPLVIFQPVQQQIYGEIDGVYWVSGTGGITSEDILTDNGESPEVDHLIFQNVHRTDIWTFFAMRLD